MPYSTWGYVTHDDIRDIEESMDLGTIHVYLDDPRDWFKVPGNCPLEGCEQAISDHESFTVTRAGGTIVACTTFD